jgi:glycerol-3-phosphate acyltransferase PlsY
MDALLSIVSAYLLGSIPTAVWIGLTYYGIDPREHGSKNAGATNTFRVLGKKPGILVLVIDIIKGAAAACVPYVLVEDPILFRDDLINLQILAAIAAVFGHIFPVFAGFKGGKGVATSLGVIIGIQPLAALICLSVFLIVFISSKYVSLGAISAAICFPFVVRFVLLENNMWLSVFSICLSFLVIIAHRKNINRLLNGSENKMNLFKKGS